EQRSSAGATARRSRGWSRAQPPQGEGCKPRRCVGIDMTTPVRRCGPTGVERCALRVPSLFQRPHADGAIREPLQFRVFGSLHGTVGAEGDLETTVGAIHRDGDAMQFGIGLFIQLLIAYRSESEIPITAIWVRN